MQIRHAISTITGLSLLASLVFVVGCRKKTEAKNMPPRGEKQTLRIAMDVWPGYYGLLVARDNLQRQGSALELKISFPEDTHRMVADFAAGGYDGICASIGDIIVAKRDDQQARLILCSDESVGADQIIGPPSLLAAGDLRGKRLTTTLGGFGEPFLNQFIQSQGLTSADVIIMNADAAAAPSLLKEGKADAVHTWEPYASKAAEQGFVKLFTSAQTPGLVLDGFFVHPEEFKDRHELLELVCTEWLKGNEEWLNDPAATEIKIRRQLTEIGAPDQSLSLQGVQLKTRAENRELFQLESDHSVLRCINVNVEYFLRKGTLTQRPAPLDTVDSSFIK